jgi:glycosyltransferase involved in cell wall biosynthesis
VEIVDVRYLSASGRGRKFFNHESAIAAIRLHRKAILGSFTPDIIHAHTLGLDSRIGVWLKGQFGCPLVVTTHGTDTMRPLKAGEGDILRADCSACDSLVAVSGPLKESLASCGTDVPIEVIHNGFIPREPVTTEKDPFRIIQVGHLIESKHFDITIRAFAALKPQFPELKLTVVGQGHLRPNLEKLCEGLGVADSVTFTGQIPNEEVFQRMCEASYFVMASHPEGFGIVYLEAMAAGCLVFGTEGQGIADIIESGENGYLVPPNDAESVAFMLEYCLNHPAEAAAMAARGQTLASSMTWAQASSQYLSLFQSILKNS